MTQIKGVKQTSILLAITYLFYFAQLGVFTPFLGVFLDGRGLSSVEIGQLMAFITFCRILLTNLWAFIADKSGRELRVMQVGSLLSFICFLGLFWAEGFWQLALSLGLVMMFWTAVLPQLESITLGAVKGNSATYSHIRLWGSVGFIAFSIIAGWLIDRYGSDSIIYLCSFILGSLFLANLSLPSVHQPKNETGDITSIWKKLLHPCFILFILSALFLQISFGPFYGFFALYMLDLGYSGQQTGWLVAIGVIAEIGVFLYSGKWIAKFGLRQVIFVSIAFTAVRWYILAALAQHGWLLIVSQLIHALSFALVHAASVNYVHQFFGATFQNRGQAIYVSLSFGVGGTLGNYIAGQLWQQGEGAFVTFMFAAISAAIGAALMLLIPKKAMLPSA